MTNDLRLNDKEPAWLRAAMDAANVPTLACMLVMLTGERRWIEGRYLPTRTRGMDDNDDGGLPSSVQSEIRDRAYEELKGWFNGKKPVLDNPSDELLREMMGASLGESIPDAYAPMIRHELHLPELGVEIRAKPEVPEGFTALIIGAGISGLCAAIELKKAGVPFVIVERRENLGGVWFENRYPGAACDVPSHLYSFSFAPFKWSQYFAGSREIHRYLEEVADQHDLRRHIRFGLEVVEARYDERNLAWEAEVRNADGTTEILRASMVISGVGAFNKPLLPDLPGMGSFRGPSVHTARYPNDGLDLSGKRVVLIGNGASAMQVAPAIADQVASLTVIQRTPQWAAPFPKFKQSIPEAIRSLLAEVPLYRLWYRLRLSWAFNDKLYDALQQDPEWQNGGRSINAINEAHRKGLTAYIESELGQARHLLDRVLPPYPPFGKRMLLDNGWFRTLARKNVQLVTGSVTEVRPEGVVTNDGTCHEADVLIWATGFDVIHLLVPMKVKGIGGRDLQEDWEGDNARAYLGTVVPGYPNLFCLYGPNTQFGHGGSLISVLERQMHYVCSLLDQMFEKGIRSVEVRADKYEEYNRRVDEQHARMIWTYGNVSGYYRNSRGRVIVNNPFRIIDVWKMTETANLSDYHCVSGTSTAQVEF